jgi:hypothetical protein
MNKSNETQFILKLFNIVQNSESDEIIGWSLDGEELVIKDIEKFCKRILNVFFKHSSLTSFIR